MQTRLKNFLVCEHKMVLEFYSKPWQHVLEINLSKHSSVPFAALHAGTPSRRCGDTQADVRSLKVDKAE